MATYNYDRVRLYASQMVDHIGLENLYTKENHKYPNAPANYFLGNYELLIHFLKNHLEEIGTPKKIHIIDRRNVEHLIGMYANMPENIYINLGEKLNECWRRFTIIKEICSAYVGHYQNEIRNNIIYEGETNYIRSVEEAFWNKVTYINEEGLREGDLDSETFAILLATELMVPASYKEITKAYIKQVDEGKLALNDVAKSLLMPESVLKFYRLKGLL